MHRISGIFDILSLPEVLETAADNACKSRKDKGEVAAFLQDRDRLLQKLRRELLTETYVSSEYRMFTIHEKGKERLVADLPLYPDRILHWAICLAVEDKLNAKLIAQTYASIPGRGFHQAVHQVYTYVRNDPKAKYALVMDVRKFYQSIDLDVLKKKLEAVIKDRRFLRLMFRLLDEYPCGGLPLGNRYSPMLANLYLSNLDHLLKETHHVHYYVRFMDDMCVIGYSKPWLRRILGVVQGALAEDGLTLKGNYQIFPIDSRGIPFLGYRIYSDHILLKRRNKVKMMRAAGRVLSHCKASGEMSAHDMGTVASYRGMLKWCNGRHLDKKIFGPIENYCPRK